MWELNVSLVNTSKGGKSYEKRIVLEENPLSESGGVSFIRGVLSICADGLEKALNKN